jgi:glycosyltransferase involved in cell wall biosynthesis
VRLLLLHQNYPGQFAHLAAAAHAAGAEVVGLGARPEPQRPVPGRYRACGGDPVPACRHPDPARVVLGQLEQGQRVRQQLQILAIEGWRPDLVVAHPFWGEALYLDDVFPQVPLLAFLELDLSGIDPEGFDPAAAVHANRRDAGAGRSLRQWADWQALKRMTLGFTSTGFQRSTFPTWLQPRLRVAHEGIDLSDCRPDPLARLMLPDGQVLRAGQPIVTFASRSLEPLRGFHRLMACLPALQRAHPTVQVVVVGDDDTTYGPPPPPGRQWREWLLAEAGGRLDPSRLHWLGRVEHGRLHDLFRVSSAHVYFTYPYVLSWSLLEAMACGALVVGSRTAPVEEVIDHGRNGLLVDFFDADALVATLLRVLADPRGQAPLRLEARRTVLQRYGREACMATQLALLQEAMGHG